jgi:hypothetical protein
VLIDERKTRLFSSNRREKYTYSEKHFSAARQRFSFINKQLRGFLRARIALRPEDYSRRKSLPGACFH